jgi:hypothetical protein
MDASSAQYITDVKWAKPIVWDHLSNKRARVAWIEQRQVPFAVDEKTLRDRISPTINSLFTMGTCERGPTIEMEPSYHDKVLLVISALLSCGMHLYFLGANTMILKPSDMTDLGLVGPGALLTPIHLECIQMAYNFKFVEHPDANVLRSLGSLLPAILLCEDSWYSEAGKMSVRLLNKAIAYASSQQNANEDDDVVFLRSVHQSPSRQVLTGPDPAVIAPETPVSKPKEEEFVCMICFENPPDTIVKPCDHCVVCSACSKLLKTTETAKRCVACRQNITTIEYPHR